ncbi:MAG: SUMF1/EgtB/PvdO family nonheme iron enzyme [Caldilineaceae bacterium]
MARSEIETQTAAASTRSTAPRPTTQMVIGCLVIPLLVAIGIGAVALWTWRTASTELTVPNGDVLLVHNQPAEDASLLARFGIGHLFHVTGRSADWRWLEVELWDGQTGWALRPLDIFVWQISAEQKMPQPNATLSTQPTPITEQMIPIAGGVFTMGSPPGVGEADETPAHTVTLSPFAIDRTEVTVGQYWQCVQARACAAPTGSASQSQPHYLNDVAFDNYPVIHVPWSEAKAYCTWRGARLPTEAEWEMAAGWDAARNAKVLWPWGNDAAAASANVNGQAADAATVGSFPDDHSPSGVLDMGGNVREWVLDWYKVDYYSVADATDPTGPSNRRGEGAGRVVRGASFANNVDQARTANRGHEDPAYGYATVGFRCAQDR